MKVAIEMKKLLYFLMPLFLIVFQLDAAVFSKISEIQPGTENVNLVANGDFESDTWYTSWNGGAFVRESGYGTLGGIYKNMGFGTGKVLAFYYQPNTGYIKHTATENKLAAGTYVLSYYVWNLGKEGNDAGWKNAQIRDAWGTAFSAINCYSKASAGYEDAVGGYFVYQEFTINKTNQNFRLDLRTENWANYTGGSGDPRVDSSGVYLAFDNIAITPLSQFVPPCSMQLPLTADFYQDDKVDFADLAIFCQQWLVCNRFPQEYCVDADRSVYLLNQGQSEFTIVLSDSATAAEIYAAQQFAYYISQSSEVNLPIIYENQLPQNTENVKMICIGLSETARSLYVPSYSTDTMDNESILTYISPNGIVLAGGSDRATIYAVNEFLRSQLGIEWWTSTSESVPSHRSLILNPGLKIHKPSFGYRDAYFRDLVDNQQFCVRMARNGVVHENVLPAQYGGSIKIAGWAHTFFQLLPTATYFGPHPEWYSQINGSRVSDGQLCLTNQNMITELTARALNLLTTEQTDIVSISQNDNERRCQCAQCLALEASEGSRAAGPLLRAVNQVAASVKNSYPDAMVTTLAYQYTENPPTVVRPTDNVIMQLCSVKCDLAKPFEQNTTHVPTQQFIQNLSGWSAISPHLSIWTYCADFQDRANLRPNWLTIADNLRLYADNKAEGVFLQNTEPGKYQQTNFVELRAWLASRLMWDLSQNEIELRNKFLNGYYGAAASYLANYMDYMYNALQSSGIILKGFDALPAEVGFITNTVYAQASSYFNQAQNAVVSDSKLLARVRRERFALEYAALNEYAVQRHRIPKSSACLFGSDQEALTAVNNLRTLAGQAGINLTLQNDYKYTLGQRINNLESNLTLQLKSPTQLGLAVNNGWMITPEMLWLPIASNAVIVSDSATASGQYVYLTGPGGWVGQYLTTSHVVGQSYRIYIRMEANEVQGVTQGTAATIGIYDEVQNLVLNSYEVPVGMISNGYQWFDIGVHNLQLLQRIYIAPGPTTVPTALNLIVLFC